MIQPLQKTARRFLKKLKIEPRYDPVIPLLHTYPKEIKSLYQRVICTPMFIAAVFTIAKIWKQPKCPSTDESIKKMWYIYTMEYYSIILYSFFNNIVLPFGTTYKNLEDIMLNKISQTKTSPA